MAVREEMFCNGDHATYDTPWVDRLTRWTDDLVKVAGSARPIVVEILGEGLCSAVGVVWLMMMMMMMILIQYDIDGRLV
jgi:hypothetical protein